MDDFAKFLKVLVLVAAVVAIGAVVGWLGTRGSVTTSPQTGASGPKTPLSSSVSTLPQTPGPRPIEKISAPPGSNPVANARAKVAPENVITNWEDRLDDVLAQEKTEKEKAQQLMQMFARLPEDGQVEVAQHLANLTEDQDYAGLGSFLTNSALPEDVLDVFLSDLLNRPNSMKLPLLVGVARDPSNPKAAEAKDLLELYLEEDYGTDWKLWQQKADEWLKDNPD